MQFDKIEILNTNSISENMEENLILIKPKINEDIRGYFYESFNEKSFEKIGINIKWIQDNHVFSFYKSLRGMHFREGQSKLIRCISGEILDVVIDLRKNSKTFKKYWKIKLSETNKNILFIPEGFAHGYFVLSKISEILYKTNMIYKQNTEKQIKWDDQDINIGWELSNPIISERDKSALTFKDYFGEKK